MRQAEATLAAPRSNWDQIYLRIRMSPIGADFPRERFLRTPISGIQDLLAYLDNEEQRRINLSSSSVAMLAYQVASIAFGMGGQKPPAEMTTESFLPFGGWKPAADLFSPEGDTPHPISSPSRTPGLLDKLTRLLKQQRLPVHVYLDLRDLVK